METDRKEVTESEKRFTIKVEPEFKDRLRRVAFEKRTGMSTIARRALEAEVERLERE